ncbi:MAG TPA: LuxR C-terminal-related transcriptional regulator [Polyangiaceae bacterium]|nr:LuxR C-terminal-related transcriptional regulator [Polyangiaceae bacterium]
MANTEDPISLVEAAYRVEADQGAWLNQLADAAGTFDRGLGLIAFSARIVPAHGLQLDANATRRMDSGLEDFLRVATQANPAMGAEAVQQGASGSAATASEALGAGVMSGVFAPAQRWGCKDLLGIMSVDPGGSVVGLMVALPEVGGLSRRERVQWDRLSAHVCAGQRLQRRLLEASAVPSAPADLGDAVLRLDGRLEHAGEIAKTQMARASLRDAALAMDKARSSLRRKDPDEALSMWRALVSGRWSLVDKFDSDGRRFLVAHKNDPRTRAVAALTAREQQVTAYLALGHSNKRIAYELGLSESTVSEVGRRSLTKLGISSRADLARLYAGNVSKPQTPDPAP